METMVTARSLYFRGTVKDLRLFLLTWANSTLTLKQFIEQQLQ